MTEPLKNVINLDQYQAELVLALPELYSDEGEREIVKSILIPEFRVLIEKVFVQFDEKYKHIGFQYKDISILCDEIDKAIAHEKDLLNVDGLFIPALEKITLMRHEVRNAFHTLMIKGYLLVLSYKGITDFDSLMAKGINWFKAENFAPYGKGYSFAARVLGRTVSSDGELSLSTLQEMAQVLGFSKVSQAEKIEHYKKVLAHKGITDRQTLLYKGVNWFKAEDFYPYGKGKSFANAIIGKPIEGRLSMATLEKIADALGFVKLDGKEIFAHYKVILAEKGVAERDALLAKGPMWFMREEFAPYGKGYAFASLVLSRSLVKTGENITLSIIEEVSDRLGLINSDPAKKEAEVAAYKIVLADKGITSCASLFDKGSNWFVKEDFAPYGKGNSFAGRILGKTFGNGTYITLQTLQQIADKLGL